MWKIGTWKPFLRYSKVSLQALICVKDKNTLIIYIYIQGLLEAREELRPLLSKPNDRLKDLLFLDIALDSTVRTAIERSYEELSNAKPEVNHILARLISSFALSVLFNLDHNVLFQKVMYLITLLLENLILSSDNNEDLIYCLKVTSRFYRFISSKTLND